MIFNVQYNFSSHKMIESTYVAEIFIINNNINFHPDFHTLHALFPPKMTGIPGHPEIC